MAIESARRGASVTIMARNLVNKSRTNHINYWKTEVAIKLYISWENTDLHITCKICFFFSIYRRNCKKPPLKYQAPSSLRHRRSTLTTCPFSICCIICVEFKVSLCYVWPCLYFVPVLTLPVGCIALILRHDVTFNPLLAVPCILPRRSAVTHLFRGTWFMNWLLVNWHI